LGVFAATPKTPPNWGLFLLVVDGGSLEQKTPRRQAGRGFSVDAGQTLEDSWSPRQESNLYLALRRRLFYPLNYGERIV
jgi:hypothetical protein